MYQKAQPCETVSELKNNNKGDNNGRRPLNAPFVQGASVCKQLVSGETHSVLICYLNVNGTFYSCTALYLLHYQCCLVL